MTKRPIRGRLVARATPMNEDDRDERRITLLLLMIACLLLLLVGGCYLEKRPLPRADQRRMSNAAHIKCSQFGRTAPPSGYRGWRVVKITEYYAVLKKGRHKVTVPCR